MRWFKHYTDAGLDQKLRAVKGEFGYEGYGVYWSILENIGRNVDEKNDTKITLNHKNWKEITGFSPKKLEVFLNFCSEICLFSVKKQEKYITVDCPKLLKYRDEWTRKKAKNSGAAPDPIKEEEIEEDIDKEEDIGKKNNKKENPPDETIDLVAKTEDSPAEPEEKKPKSVVTAAPDIFPLTEQMIAYAAKNKITDLPRLQVMTEDFLIHHRKKGSKWKCWYSAWQQWLRNDLKWQGDDERYSRAQPGATNTGPGNPPNQSMKGGHNGRAQHSRNPTLHYSREDFRNIDYRAGETDISTVDWCSDLAEPRH